jgi:pSer/pThr/pTyr-binding forkhead associated (FHA) protein
VNAMTVSRDRLVAWLIAAVVLGAHAEVAFAQGLANVPGAVVHLFVSSDDSFSTGSGFVINDQGTIITNHHVIDAAKAPNAGRIYLMDERRARELGPTLRDPSTTLDEAFEVATKGAPMAEVLWSDPLKDLAILKVASPVTVHALPLVPSDLVHINDRVIPFGFPGLNLSIGPGSLVVLDQRPGEITSKHEETRRNRLLFSTSATTYKGMSGGPAVNACGELIGINFGGFGRVFKKKNPLTQQEEVTGMEEIDMFIQVDTLLPELDARSIPYTRISKRCEPDQSRTIALPIIPSRDPVLTGGVITAIVLGLISVGLGLTKRGRTAVRTATESVSRRLSRREEPGPRDAKGAAKPQPGKTPPSSPPQQNAKKPSSAIPLLFGVSGEYNGVELELGQEPVAIGRDPRVSHLVFSPNTRVVSGRHCAVWFDTQAKSVMVEDLWSTNGTYLGDGRRLEGGRPYPLRSAEQFYLGDPDVLFEVRY